MPSFSKKSHALLCACDPRLQDLFIEVVTEFDCAILTGHRNATGQEIMFDAGLSKVHFPGSKHNSMPSMAVDVAPYPIDWNNRDRFHFFAGYVMGVAIKRGIKLRWGGDWDGDWETKDNNFDDLLHFELR